MTVALCLQNTHQRPTCAVASSPQLRPATRHHPAIYYHGNCPFCLLAGDGGWHNTVPWRQSLVRPDPFAGHLRRARRHVDGLHRHGHRHSPAPTGDESTRGGQKGEVGGRVLCLCATLAERPGEHRDSGVKREVAEHPLLSASHGAAPSVHDVDGKLPSWLQLARFTHDHNANPHALEHRSTSVGNWFTDDEA